MKRFIVLDRVRLANGALSTAIALLGAIPPAPWLTLPGAVRKLNRFRKTAIWV